MERGTMSPSLLGPRLCDDSAPELLASDKPQTFIFRVDSPLGGDRVDSRIEEINDGDDQTLTIRQRPNMPPQRRSKSSDAARSSSPPSERFLFCNIKHPGQLKDKDKMRENRRHVMRNYLDIESGRRNSKDIRVSNRKRYRPGAWEPQPNLVPDSFEPNFEPSEWFNASSLKPLGGESSRASSSQGSPATHQLQSKESVVVNPVSESPYIPTDLNNVPFQLRHLGGELNPFETWPAFEDTSVNVGELKYSCSQRFGSRGMSIHWVPMVLKARHAFLSTICISSAHDDIMSRASLPAHRRSKYPSVERIRVCQEVIKMINESIKDPQMQTSDTTIVAVLHLLNSEIMGCDDKTMHIHSKGLHSMVKQRGGLDKLGINGQLASILTITMYMMAALCETPPHSDFVMYAMKQNTKIFPHAQNLPESPIYCRPTGFQTINQDLAPGSATLDLLDDVRRLTNRFFVEIASSLSSRAGQQHQQQPKGSVSSVCEKIFALQPAESKDGFDDMSARYVYESVRLVSLVYAQALRYHIPFSQAARQVSRIVANSSISDRQQSDTNFTSPPTPLVTVPIHTLIKNALICTDTSHCWGPLSGVLFWVALIAGAAANPSDSANKERNGEDEEARKWLTTVAVRCSIVLSFEHGSAVLETLKRVVGLEAVLKKTTDERKDPNISTTRQAVVDDGVGGDTWCECPATDDGPVLMMAPLEEGAKDSYGPVAPPAQQYFQQHIQQHMPSCVDFARDFWDC